MNRLGMLVDLSHVSPGRRWTTRSTCREAPVIFSHSSRARRVPTMPRNVPDSILRRLPQNGGVVMVTFVAALRLAGVRATSRTPLWQEYQKRTAGVADRRAARAHPQGGLANAPASRRGHASPRSPITSTTCARSPASTTSASAATSTATTTWPEGLEDVSKYPYLFAELIRRGWSDADLEEARRRERAAGASPRPKPWRAACRRRARRRPPRSSSSTPRPGETAFLLALRRRGRIDSGATVPVPANYLSEKRRGNADSLGGRCVDAAGRAVRRSRRRVRTGVLRGVARHRRAGDRRALEGVRQGRRARLGVAGSDLQPGRAR